MAGASSEAGHADAKKGQEGQAAEGKAAAGAAGGGIKAFLPLIIAVVAMPGLAFVTTNFLILPKIKAAISQSGGATAAAAPAEDSVKEVPKEGASKESGGKEGAKTGGKAKVTYAMSKILVNVAGTMGTRYLMSSFTLVGTNPDLKTKADDNKDQLLDLATSTLSSKTIADLEKPGSRNIIRSELMTVFNNALGGPLVQEIYITEMAIQ